MIAYYWIWRCVMGWWDSWKEWKRQRKIRWVQKKTAAYGPIRESSLAKWMVATVHTCSCGDEFWYISYFDNMVRVGCPTCGRTGVSLYLPPSKETTMETRVRKLEGRIQELERPF